MLIKMLDTHYYDGKIEQSLIFNTYTLEEKIEKGKELYKSNFNPQSLHYLKIMINHIGTDLNIDHTNNINSDDLLCLCWLHKDNDAFMKELELQLFDMASGNCAQGCCYRLYQLLLAFKND
jgi:hypothetical protein